MTIDQTDIIGKIRTAIDDIVPAGVTDSFVTDVDAELWQAVQHATTQLSIELPLDLLDASVETLTGTVDANRGFAYGKLSSTYLRFVSLDVPATAGIIRELMEPGSDAEKMQRSAWGRATSSKPKAMLDQDELGRKVIVWWPGDATHNSAELAYIDTPNVSGTTITCAIREEAEQQIIYRAASIFFEGKKESEIAEKFRNIEAL